MESGGTMMQNILLDALEDLCEADFSKFKFKLRTTTIPGDNNIPRGRLEKASRQNVVELMTEYYENKAITLTVAIFEDIGLKNNASKLSKELGKQIQGYKKKYAENVIEEYQLITDRNSLLGESIPLAARYIELLMVKKHRSQKQREHELIATGRLHLELLDTHRSENSSVDLESLFDPDESKIAPRTVVLLGPAGIGKTVTSQKIMLDWAAGKLYQNMFDFVFCIRCRELSLGKETSLADFIVEQCQDMYAPVKDIIAGQEKLLFIIDGFDELSCSLEPEDHFCDNPESKVSMECVLSSLLHKKLLPKSYLLITTRPGAAERLQRCLKFPRFTEILGFSEKGRREYFLKFFEDERKAYNALRFIENTAAVSTICFIPMVCWIICSIIKVELETEDEIAVILDTTTKVFLLFLHYLLEHNSRKWKTLPQKEIRQLCFLARNGILEQKILFEDQDLRENNLEESVLKNLFLDKRAFQRGIGRYHSYSFLHLCFQEFFAAMSYILQEEQTTPLNNNMEDLKRLLAVCETPGNEHLTLTVCFVYGLSSEKARIFLEQTLRCKTSDLVKPVLLQRAEEVASEEPPRQGDHLLNFFHYLFESQEAEFAKHVMHHFQTIDLSFRTLSVLDCRVLAFCLQHSTCNSHEVELTFCRLQSHHMKALASGIKNCTALEFGSNKLGNSGASILCSILKELACNVTTLNLNENNLTDACAQELCTVLSTSQVLYSLSLQDNYFTEASLPFIFRLMETCTSLCIVSLGSNRFGDKGRKRLRKQEEKITNLGRQFLLWM